MWSHTNADATYELKPKRNSHENSISKLHVQHDKLIAKHVRCRLIKEFRS